MVITKRTDIKGKCNCFSCGKLITSEYIIRFPLKRYCHLSCWFVILKNRIKSFEDKIEFHNNLLKPFLKQKYQKIMLLERL